MTGFFPEKYNRLSFDARLFRTLLFFLWTAITAVNSALIFPRFYDPFNGRYILDEVLVWRVVCDDGLGPLVLFVIYAVTAPGFRGGRVSAVSEGIIT